MKEAPACRPASRGACGAGTLILTHSDSRNARRPCHMGRPPRSGLECRGQLAYARKGLASGQPANARTGETNPGISSGRDSALRAGRGPSSPAGILVKCRRNLGQVSPESWSSVIGILVKCRRNLGQVSRKLQTSSFFFVSTEMTGWPSFWKARTLRSMRRNCASRSGCRRPSTVLRLDCRL